MMQLDTKYHILLLGGTGICGLIFTRAALKSGHTLTLYCRTPSKIPSDLTSNPRLSTIQGEFNNVEGLKKAAACGADVFLSFAGPTLGRRDGTPITNMLKTLYPLLISSGTIKRILVLSTASYTAPEDAFSLKWWLSINCYIKLLGGDAYSEICGLTQETANLGERVGWTAFRVPLLCGTKLEDGALEGDLGVNAAYVGDRRWRDGLWLYRGRLARWVLNELDEGKWVGYCPLVSNADGWV